MCSMFDPAVVTIERFQGGQLDVLYSLWPHGCSGPCCDPQEDLRSRVLAHFFDRLASLIECKRWPRTE